MRGSKQSVGLASWSSPAQWLVRAATVLSCGVLMTGAAAAQVCTEWQDEEFWREPASTPQAGGEAAWAGAYGEAIRVCLDTLADLNVQAPDGRTLLRLAVKHIRDPQVLNDLIARGADVDGIGQEPGVTPLMVAAAYNPEPAITLHLIELGADPSRAVQGLTPLLLAATTDGQRRVLTALIGSGVDVQVRDSSGYTALHRAARFLSDPTVIAELQAAGLDINATAADASTPLHVAALANTPAMVRAILDADADPNAMAPNGLTPLLIAATMNPHPEVTEVLLEAGARVNDQLVVEGVQGTVLHGALQMAPRPTGIIAALLDAGASVLVSDSAGVTPMEVARTVGQPPGIMELLEAAEARELAAAAGANTEPQVTPAPMVEDCGAITGDEARLACYDQTARSSVAGETTGGAVAETDRVTWPLGVAVADQTGDEPVAREATRPVPRPTSPPGSAPSGTLSVARGDPVRGCGYVTGDVVDPLTPVELAAAAGALQGQRGEFETTAEFEARVGTGSIPPLVAGQSVLVELDYDPAYVRYDADRERFEVERFAWSNFSGLFDATLVRANPGLGYDLLDVVLDPIGLGIHREGQVVRTYEATNGFGARVTVSEVVGTGYGVFDKPGSEGFEFWAYDFGESGSVMNDTWRGSGIYLPVPQDYAPVLKDSLRFALQYTPREPLILSGTNVVQATFDSPEDRRETIHTFIGSLDCVLAMDANGLVLRVLANSYQ